MVLALIALSSILNQGIDNLLARLLGLASSDETIEVSAAGFGVG